MHSLQSRYDRRVEASSSLTFSLSLSRLVREQLYLTNFEILSCALPYRKISLSDDSLLNALFALFLCFIQRQYAVVDCTQLKYKFVMFRNCSRNEENLDKQFPLFFLSSFTTIFFIASCRNEGSFSDAYHRYNTHTRLTPFCRLDHASA